ncbi:MAG: hypothetical protein ACREK1_05275 [Longimicrobiales bacterium]
MRVAAVMSLLAAAAAACGGATEPPDQAGSVRHIEAGDTVRLRYGESARLGSDGPLIVFRSVEEDSRCPVDVTCVWAGDAHVRLDASQLSGTSQPIDLHTTLDPKEAGIAGYRIRLLDVAPARTDQDAVRPEHYSILLAISRG